MTNEFHDSWKNPAIPERQWAVIHRERQLVSEGRYAEVSPYRVIVEAMRIINPPKGASVLEIGASSGFYDRLFKAAGVDVKYTALDYSPAFKEFAAKVHPDIPYILGDAVALPVEAETYDVVISGCCLIHIPEWRLAVREAVRVSKKHVIFHRTPLHHRETTMFIQDAYGVDSVSNIFQWDEFLRTLGDSGLKVISNPLEVWRDVSRDYGHFTVVCEKV